MIISTEITLTRPTKLTGKFLEDQPENLSAEESEVVFPMDSNPLCIASFYIKGAYKFSGALVTVKAVLISSSCRDLIPNSKSVRIFFYDINKIAYEPHFIKSLRRVVPDGQLFIVDVSNFTQYETS